MSVAAIDLLDLDLFARTDEHRSFRTLRAEQPIAFQREPDGPGFWSLTRHAHVAAAARDNMGLRSGQGTQIRDRRAEGSGHASVHNSDPPIHGRLRAVVLPALARNAVAPRTERIARMAGDLIDAIEPGEPFDFVADIAVRLPMMVIADVLGVPEQDSGRLVDWANLMSDVRASDSAQAEARAALYAYFRGLADQRRAEPRDDIASALVAAGLEDDAVDAYFMLLTVAGNETTRFLLAGGIAQLARQPAEWRRLQSDRSLVDPLIEEMCRFVSPVAHMRRTAAADMDLFGTPIRRGDKVVLWFASANRDERVFANADRLVIDRAPNPHLGFGLGPHFCVGAHLARLEVRLFLHALLDRVAELELLSEPKRLPSNWFTGWTEQRMRWR